MRWRILIVDYLPISYADKLISVLPSSVSHLLIQSIAGSLGGFTTTIITNPLDIIRARLQVSDPD